MNAAHDYIRDRLKVKPQYDGVASLHDLSCMANDIYDLHSYSTIQGKHTPAGWTIMEQIQTRGDGFNVQENLAMAVYVNKGRTAVLVLKGTDKDNMDDVSTGILGILRGQPPSKPLIAAATLVKKWQDQGYTVMVTGHSLGGYMAEIVATHIGLAGVGFCVPPTGWHAGDLGRRGTYVNICEESDSVISRVERACSWADRKMKTIHVSHGKDHGIKEMMNFLKEPSGTGAAMGRKTNQTA